jgi:hypothetical protein
MVQQVSLDGLLVEAQERVVGLRDGRNQGRRVIGHCFVQDESMHLHRQGDVGDVGLGHDGYDGHEPRREIGIPFLPSGQRKESIKPRSYYRPHPSKTRRIVAKPRDVSVRAILLVFFRFYM